MPKVSMSDVMYNIDQIYDQGGNDSDVENMIIQAGYTPDKFIAGQTKETQPSVPNITEEERKDIIEETERPSLQEGALKVGASAKREVGELAEAGKVLGQAALRTLPDVLAQSLVPGISNFSADMRKRNKERADITLSVLKELPAILKEVGKDFARSVGIDPNNPSRKPDVDVLLNKFMDKPIETATDISLISGIAKKIGVSTSKKIASKIANKEKGKLLEIIKKDDLVNKQIAKTLSDSNDINTPLNDLMNNSILKRKDIKLSQLENPNVKNEIGKNVISDVNRMQKRDQLKLEGSLKGISDEPIEKSVLSERILEDFKMNGLVDEDNVLDQTYNLPLVRKEIKDLSSDTPLTVGDVRKRIKNIDNKLNFTKKVEAQEALGVIRNKYREVLTEMSPEYDDIAKRISDKLDKFKTQLKSFKKVGKGEKFGKTPFSTTEEMDEFINVMERADDRLANKIIGDLQVLKAHKDWSDYFKMPIREGFLSKVDVPLAKGKVLQRAEKTLLKRKIERRPETLVFPGVRKAAGISSKGAKSPLVRKTGFLAGDINERKEQ